MEEHMAFRLFAASLLASIAATSAIAQPAWVEIGSRVTVPAFSAIVDDVDDWDVYSVDGQEIGEVEEVLGPDARTPTALAIDFEGNAGFVDRDIIVPLDRFALEQNRLVLRASPSEVEAMERHRD